MLRLREYCCTDTDSTSRRATATVSPVEANRSRVVVKVCATDNTSESAVLRATTPSISRTFVPNACRNDSEPALVSVTRTLPPTLAGTPEVTGTYA